MKKFLTTFPTIITAAIIAISSIVTGLSFSIKNEKMKQSDAASVPFQMAAGDSLFRTDGDHNWDKMLELVNLCDLDYSNEVLNDADGGTYNTKMKTANKIRALNGGTLPRVKLFESIYVEEERAGEFTDLEFVLVCVTAANSTIKGDPIFTFYALQPYQAIYYPGSMDDGTFGLDMMQEHLYATADILSVYFPDVFRNFVKNNASVEWLSSKHLSNIFKSYYFSTFGIQMTLNNVEAAGGKIYELDDIYNREDGYYDAKPPFFVPSVYDIGGKMNIGTNGNVFYDSGMWNLAPGERADNNPFNVPALLRTWSFHNYNYLSSSEDYLMHGFAFGNYSTPVPLHTINGAAIRPAINITLPRELIESKIALRELRTENANLNSTITQKLNEISALETTIGTTNPPTGLRGEIADLQNQITAKDGVISTLTTEKTNLYNSIHDPVTGYLKQIQNLTNQKAALQELYDLQNDVTIPALNEQIDDAQREIDRFSALIYDPDTGYLKQIANLRGEKSALQGQLDDLNNVTIPYLNGQIETLSGEKSTLEHDLQNAQSEYSALDELYQQLLIDDGINQTTITNLQGQISTLSGEKTNLYNLIHDPNTGYLKQIADLTTERNNLQTDKTNLQTDKTNLQTDLTNAENSYRTLNELYETLLETNTANEETLLLLQTQINTLNNVTIPNLQSQITAKDGEISDKDAQISQLNTDIATLTGEKNGLQSDLESANRAYEDLDALYQLLLEGNYDETIAELQGQLAAANALINDPNTGYLKQIADKNTQIGDLQSQLDTANNVTIPDLQSQITEKDADISTKQGQLDTLNNVTIPNLNGQITTKQNQIDTLNNVTIPNLNGQISTLTTERNTAQNSLTTANENLTLKTNQLTAANNDKIALENQVTERNTTIYGLNTQLTKAKSDYDDLVRVYNTLERQNSNLKDQIAKLQAEKPADQNNKNDTGTLYLYSTVGTGILCAVLLIMVMVYRGAAKRGKRAMR